MIIVEEDERKLKMILKYKKLFKKMIKLNKNVKILLVEH